MNFNSDSRMLRTIVELIRTSVLIPRDNPDLIQAKFAAFNRQIPIVYGMVIFNTLAVAVTHYGKAPDLLTLYLPGALDVVCIWRLVRWWRSHNDHLDHDQAIGRLRSTIVLAGILGTGFCAWAIGLFPYGDAYMQGQVMFFTGVTVIGWRRPCCSMEAARTSISPRSVRCRPYPPARRAVRA